MIANSSVVRQKPPLFVLDEIGKMELFSDKFVAETRALIANAFFPGDNCDSPSDSHDSAIHESFVLATVAVKGGGLIEEVKRMVADHPGGDDEQSICTLIEVTRKNRDHLSRELVERIKTYAARKFVLSERKVPNSRDFRSLDHPGALSVRENSSQMTTVCSAASKGEQTSGQKSCTDGETGKKLEPKREKKWTRKK